jgi:hypothetical protein
MNTIFFKLASLAAGAVGSLIAGAVFKKVWQAVAHEDDAPSPGDANHGWKSILIAAGVQGAIFAVVKAATERGTRQATGNLTSN